MKIWHLTSGNLKRCEKSRCSIKHASFQNVIHWSLTGGIKMLIRIVLCREPSRTFRHQVAHKSSWKALSKVDSSSFAAAFEFADRLRGTSLQQHPFFVPPSWYQDRHLTVCDTDDKTDYPLRSVITKIKEIGKMFYNKCVKLKWIVDEVLNNKCD